jgi:Domain of unknown function (DUF4279)
MNEAGDNAGVGTPGSSTSDRQEEEVYFAYSASLRIFGSIPSFDAITRRLGITPSEIHRKGDRRRSPNLSPYDHGMWSYRASVNQSEPLHVHIDSLWNTFSDHKVYLPQLKHDLTVDVF